jgi:hypothetical protein
LPEFLKEHKDGRFISKWRRQCGCLMPADSRGTYSIRFR